MVEIGITKDFFHMGFRFTLKISCQYHLLNSFNLLRLITDQFKNSAGHSRRNGLIFLIFSDVAGVMKISCGNQQFSIVFGYLLRYSNSVGIGKYCEQSCLEVAALVACV